MRLARLSDISDFGCDGTSVRRSRQPRCFAKSTSGSAMARASPPEFREYLRRERAPGGDEGSNSDPERSRQPSANPNPIAEIGGCRPSPAPRREKGGCFLVSFVERFLRRLRERWPQGANWISPGWPDRRELRPRNRQGSSFSPQQLDLAVRGGFVRGEDPVGCPCGAFVLDDSHLVFAKVTQRRYSGQGPPARARAPSS